MPPHASQQIRQDLDLIERFAHTYRRRFELLIDELNTSPTAETGGKCLRLCVETVNMILTAQNQLAEALRQISSEKPRMTRSCAA